CVRDAWGGGLDSW
nr:immunoglobulin heavy chain junction region [Macaca mulatta]MOV36132.1 immunoglobulin heavy chain junction region [Macaca mulatta]MOV36199.1 immunoglobulin heavy chain junction region [Macaca mulatta]MOV36326.1 immunoglobulin heavy chain junction region [Macaca mulatta]MOV36521.1 immunoglobulin heavy chain junction region [Macaca mulatta]